MSTVAIIVRREAVSAEVVPTRAMTPDAGDGRQSSKGGGAGYPPVSASRDASGCTCAR
nr:hypothetical protein [Deltaproteobacteria bacterium]